MHHGKAPLGSFVDNEWSNNRISPTDSKIKTMLYSVINIAAGKLFSNSVSHEIRFQVKFLPKSEFIMLVNIEKLRKQQMPCQY